MSEQLLSDARLLDAGDGYLFFIGKCSRCNGQGYHHGFGYHGHDPDWCDVCGGDGRVSNAMVTPWET